MRVVAGRRERFGGAAGQPQAGRGHAKAGPVDLWVMVRARAGAQARSGTARRRVSAARNCFFQGQAMGSARRRPPAPRVSLPGRVR